MEKLELNIEKTLEFLLFEKYHSEFEVIDGLNRHRNGMNFYDWLHSKKMITKEKCDEIKAKIKSEDYGD